ncbi:hypothetical protein [Phragmitibacter flavus]|nr:hypothetical protein [Phragmitibacter flavus]
MLNQIAAHVRRLTLSVIHPLILALTLFLTSCAIPYNHAWNQAAATSSTTAPTDLSGAWQGTWRSEGTGHHGKLRAIVSPDPDPKQPNAWTFRYHATWAKFLSGGYKAHHIATPQPDQSYKISGEQNLGKLFGGIFKYDGNATSTHFKATYQSKADHGVFELTRP